jgi:predicted DNA-binding transcriptional regulator AlpA
MNTYQFTLRYRLPDSAADMDALVEQLGEAGCTDAVIGLGTAGRIALTFDRDANNAEEAVYSALSAIKQALPMTELIEASPDLMGASEIAEVVGKSRQNIRQLMLANFDFPKPVHESASVTLWHLSEVLEYLRDSKGYQIDEPLIEVSIMAQGVNMAKELMRVQKLDNKLKPLVA